MFLDILIIFFILVMVALGFLSGALKQLVKIAALVMAYILARMSVPYTTPAIADMVNNNYGLAAALALGGGMVVAYLLLLGLGYVFIAYIFSADSEAAASDRKAGAALGLVKGVIIGYVATCLLVMISGFAPSLAKAMGLEASYAARIVRSNNILTKISLPTPAGFEQMYKGIKTIASTDENEHAKPTKNAALPKSRAPENVGGQSNLLDKDGKVKIIRGSRFGPGRRVPVEQIRREEKKKCGCKKKNNETSKWLSNFGMTDKPQPTTMAPPPEVSKALDNANIKNLFSNSNIMESLQNGDIFSIIGTDEFSKIMSDPEATKMLMKLGTQRYGKTPDAPPPPPE